MGFLGIGRRAPRRGVQPHTPTLAEKRTARNMIKKYLARNPGATMCLISEELDISTLVVWGVLRNMQHERLVTERNLQWYIV